MLEWFKNKIRQLEQQQERIYPNGIRGRVFASVDDTVPGRAIVKPEPKPVLTMKVMRRDGSIEHYTADAVQITKEGA